MYNLGSKEKLHRIEQLLCKHNSNSGFNPNLKANPNSEPKPKLIVEN